MDHDEGGQVTSKRDADVHRYMREAQAHLETPIDLKYEWNARMRLVFGRVRASDGQIEFSSKLWGVATDDQRREVVHHEVCHVVERSLYKSMGHGERWKELMRRCGYDTPSTSHSLTDFVIKKTVYCPCMKHIVGPVIYNRIVKRETLTYRCSSCGEELEARD